MNGLSWIVLGLVALGVVCAVGFLYRHKGAGCSGDCAGCDRRKNCDDKVE